MIAGRQLTNRSLTSRQSSRRPTNLQPLDQTTLIIQKANFVTDFFKFCENHDDCIPPEFQIIGAAESFKINSPNFADVNHQELKDESDEFSVSKENSKSESIATVFNLIYEDRIDLDAPKDFRCRGFEVNLFMLDALNNCMKKFPTLTTLKLERCSINAFGIVQISEILASEFGKSIKDLSLDGNPNIKQNYDLLCAPGIGLFYLSLKLCEINDNGLAKIAENLSHRDEPHEPKLIVLNLANNRISENGGKLIGNMLRTNRSLQSLTLAGNRINDAGAEFVIKQLSAFTLTHTETVEKRRRKLNRLKICREKMDDLSRETLKMDFLDAEGSKDQRGSLGNRVSKKRRASSRQVISNSSESSSVNRSTTAIIVQSLEEKAESIIPIDTHPLVKDVLSINGTLLCPGNFQLQHLNLSFNKIGENTLRGLINCVEKQRSTLISDYSKGLRYINVEGNGFEKSSDLVLRLNSTLR